MQVMKEAREGIHPGFKTQGRCPQKSITRVSLAPQKRTDVQPKIFLKSIMVKFDYRGTTQLESLRI